MKLHLHFNINPKKNAKTQKQFKNPKIQKQFKNPKPKNNLKTQAQKSKNNLKIKPKTHKNINFRISKPYPLSF